VGEDAAADADPSRGSDLEYFQDEVPSEILP